MPLWRVFLTKINSAKWHFGINPGDGVDNWAANA